MLRTFKTADPESLKEVQEEKKIRRTDEVFLLFAMGSQFDHLIKNSLEKLAVFCLVANPSTVTAEDVKALNPKGIIVSGGPASMATDPPKFDYRIFDLKIPVLGICLGFQMWASHVGCRISQAKKREFGVMPLIADMNWQRTLLDGLDDRSPVLESHGDKINTSHVIGLFVYASTANSEVAVARHGHLYGVQFHPECSDTEQGLLIFANFVFGVCQARDRFPAERVAQRKIDELAETVGNGRIVLLISGGSDSATVAYLLAQAMKESGGQLLGLYIKGVDRPDDEQHVLQYFGDRSWIDLHVVDATEKFLEALDGKRSMKSKRVAVREVYRQVAEKFCTDWAADFIAQGTLYTDISESGSGYDSGAKKAQIKLHHNVGLDFSRPELVPLADCVKDSGRNIGRAIGVPEALLTRHPFPGPGLVVRIEGAVTATKLEVAKQCDRIFIEELKKADLYTSTWQAGSVVTNSVTTCTKGDDATRGWVIALWAVWSVNGFTARVAELPWEFVKKVSQRITNEIQKTGSVVYRISDKPPATIEWG